MKRIEKISKRWQKISLSDKEHTAVMCREVIEYLNPGNKRLIVDCTLGLGGHAQEILKAMPVQGQLIGIDKDEESLALAQERLKAFAERVHFFHSDLRDVDEVLSALKLNRIEGALFDLGASMHQLGSYERGFSLLREGPLDMRMDRNSLISAYDLVNHLSEKELDYIFTEYGQERWHRKIAHYIIEERRNYPITTTMQLAAVVLRAMGNIQQKIKLHPATRVFQALRIAVNQELDSLRIGLEKITRYLAPGARVCVISFHSLEDKIVKETFRKFRATGKFRILTPRPLRPEFWEVKMNIKARSARLRVLEKI